MEPTPPGTVPVKMRAAVLATTVEVTVLPEAARSGVLKYSYLGREICSTTVLSALVSRSNTLKEVIAPLGSMMDWLMSVH